MILAYHFLPNQDLTQTQHSAHISMDSLQNPFIKLKQVVQLLFCCTLPHTFKYYKAFINYIYSCLCYYPFCTWFKFWCLWFTYNLLCLCSTSTKSVTLRPIRNYIHQSNIFLLIIISFISWLQANLYLIV
jgi:hypothetical protein